MEGSHHSGPSLNHDGAYFTTVRNHWDAIASWWYRMVGQSPEAVKRGVTRDWFVQWVVGHGNYHTVGTAGRVPRLWWFLDTPGKVHVMRYETLQEDLHLILNSHGLLPVDLPVIGRDSGREGVHYRDVMSPEVAAHIHDTFAEEIEELGYSY